MPPFKKTSVLTSLTSHQILTVRSLFAELETRQKAYSFDPLAAFWPQHLAAHHRAFASAIQHGYAGKIAASIRLVQDCLRDTAK